MHNPEHDSDDEFGDGIDWGDEPEIDAAASCNLENPEECEACGGTGMGPQVDVDDYDKCKQCNGAGSIDPEEGMYFDYDYPDYPDYSTYRDNSGY